MGRIETLAAAARIGGRVLFAGMLIGGAYLIFWGHHPVEAAALGLLGIYAETYNRRVIDEMHYVQRQRDVDTGVKALSGIYLALVNFLDKRDDV